MMLATIFWGLLVAACRMMLFGPDDVHTQRAFPEAAGWGANALTTCDRSTVQLLRVTNLQDNGSGSLREALEQVRSDALSIVVFDVAGIITLNSRITIRNGCLYIAGQTAPGSGITIRAPDEQVFTTVADAHDLVIRYLRIRPGSNSPGTNTSSQGLIISTGPDVIVDHVSFSWANDQLLSIYRYPWDYSRDVRNITVQRTLFAEPLSSSPVCYSTKGAVDIDGDANGIPQWYEVEKITFHHNAAIHCSHRAPLISSKDAQVLNNVVYNWNQAAMHTEGRKPYVDYINNYFKRGPMNRSLETEYAYEFSHVFQFNAPGGWTGNEPDGYVIISREKVTVDGREGPTVYLSGNVGPHNPGGTEDNWAMTSKYKNDGNSYPESVYGAVTYNQVGLMPIAVDGISLRRTTPLPQPPVPVKLESASAAWHSLIVDGDVGANRRLDCLGDWVPNADAVDRRVLLEAQRGTGPTFTQLPGSPEEVGGYPRQDSGVVCIDSDADGMPDDFETRHGLDPFDARDARADPDRDTYTNIEEYLNGTSPR